MSKPDPLDPQAPRRAFRPDTLQSYRYTFRRAASALVRSGIVPLEDITGFHVFFAGDNFREALRPFVPEDERDTGYVHKMATQLIKVARDHLRLEEKRLDTLTEIARRLAPREAGIMGKRNRVRLTQFDDEAVVSRLLRFPEAERARALRQRNPLRCAKGIERALAISILIFTGIRVKNLCHLRIGSSFRRVGKRVFLKFGAAETKTRSELDLELAPETITLLDEFLGTHRPQLPGAEGPWLFPGLTGGPRCYSAMREAVSKPLLRHAGIELSPHLYRHIIAKIVAERCPENLHDVSRMLGHKSMRTTYAAYLGTEGPAASRRLAGVLRKAGRDETDET